VGNTTLRVEREPGAADPALGEGEQSGRFGRFLGSAASLSPLYRKLQLVASTDTTVLIEGESGTGKELLAEAIHDHSPRRAGPFVVVDCGVIVANLLESALFGHERGAFTGADSTRIGAFEEAQDGTIFLDEIGELSLPHQTGLLGVLDRRQFRRLGGGHTIDLDVRVIAATNRNLDHEVEASRFRLDLFHRLAVALIQVPPLRERREDIELLARHFLGQLRGASEDLLTKDVLARMRSHEWTGNVRELRNHVERLALFGEGPEVALSPSPEPDAQTEGLVEEAIAEGLLYSQARAKAIDAFTRRYVEAMLELHGGNVSHAAQAAGVARRHFQRLKKKK
jgi:DNA-binding NtrC family response regulator